MNIKKLFVLILTLIPALTQAANKQEKLYMYGFAASFNDSTVYFTDIMEVDSAWIDAKTKFLYSRENYSYQFRDFLKRRGVDYPTCVTTYALTRKAVEKKYFSMKKRYTDKGKYDIKYVAANEFSFTPIKPEANEIAPNEKAVKEKAPKKKKGQ